MTIEPYKGKKARKTKYRDVTFKSGLEAHWASFFDRWDIPWQYEPHQVQIDSFRHYTPDFTLHLFSPPVFVEVKPTWEMVTEDERLQRLSHVTSNICLGVSGDPGLWAPPSLPHMKDTFTRMPGDHRAYYLEDGEVCAVWGSHFRSRYTFPDWITMLNTTRTDGGFQ